MFHLVHKPLTTPSFLLLCIAFSLLFLFFFFSSFFFFKFLLVATLLSPVSAFQSLSVSHSHSVPHVIGGMSSCCSNFTCWQLALSVCLSILLFHPLLFSPDTTQTLWCIFTNSPARFSWLLLKGFYRRGMEMRSDMLADFHSPLISKWWAWGNQIPKSL